MSFDPSPAVFFGNDFALASSAISFNTSTASDGIVGTFTVVGDTTAPITVSTAHNLKVGDLVALSTSGTLPAGLAAQDYYVVAVDSTLIIQISATKGGDPIAPTDAGSGTHTIKAHAVLSLLTDAEADPTTGDSRTVVLALVEMMFQKYLGTAETDKPERLIIVRSSNSNDSQGQITREYTFRITLDEGATDVSAE